MNQNPFIVPPDSKISLLKDYNPAYKNNYHNKLDAGNKLQTDILRLADYQNILYAQNNYALLMIFQAMDAAGKDSTI